MDAEIKHGKYEKFDLNKARWICPKCNEDKLMVESLAYRSPYKFILTHLFVCENCGFDSLEYGFKMRKKDSFNSAHRRLIEMWPYLVLAEKKGWFNGFNSCISKLQKKN
jgi:rubredoxin